MDKKLTVTQNDNGWAYQWEGQPSVGPFTTEDEALHAACEVGNESPELGKLELVK